MPHALQWSIQVAITHRADPAFDDLAGSVSHHSASHHATSHHSASHHSGASAARRNVELAHVATCACRWDCLGSAQPPLLALVSAGVEASISGIPAAAENTANPLSQVRRDIFRCVDMNSLLSERVHPPPGVEI
jgi:hypothetical protein